MAVFAVVDAALLRPLPIDRGGRVSTLAVALEDGSFTVGLVSDADLVNINASSPAIERAAGASVYEDSLVRPRGESLSVLTGSVTAGYFSVFDSPLQLGRGFELDEHVRPASPRLAVLSHRLWRTSFGGNHSVLNTTIRLGNQGSALVVGVASPEFDLPRGTDLWLNSRSVTGRPDTSSSFEGFIRHRPDSSATVVLQQLNAALAGAPRPYNPAPSARVPRARRAVLQPLQDALLGESRSIMVLAFAASVLVLLLGAVNVASLELVRRVLRKRELAVHLALGATRGRLLRQAASEAGLLAAAGVLGGLLLHAPFVDLVVWLAGGWLPGLGRVVLNGSVLLIGVVLSLATVVAIAVPLVRRAMADTSRSTQNEVLGFHSRARSPVVAGLIGAGAGLTVVGAAGASWLVGSYRSLASTDPGFHIAGGLIVDVQLPGGTYGNPDAAAWFSETMEALRALPGARAVGLAVTAPLAGERDFTRSIEILTTDGKPTGAARFRYVTPGFFAAAGIRILEGLDFPEGETPRELSGVVVNRVFADRYLVGGPRLGARISYLGLDRTHPQGLPVIGIVDAARYSSLMAEPEPVVYVSSVEARSSRFRQSFVMDVDPAQVDRLAPVVRERLSETAPLAAVTVERMSDRFSKQLAPRRVGMNAMLAFGAMAVLVGTIGAYALAGLGAAERRREIAVRSALGGSRSALVWLLMKRVGAPALAGVTTGLLVSLLIAEVLRARAPLFAERDLLWTLAAVGGVALAVVVAVLVPAMRVTAADVPSLLRE